MAVASTPASTMTAPAAREEGIPRSTEAQGEEHCSTASHASSSHAIAPAIRRTLLAPNNNEWVLPVCFIAPLIFGLDRWHEQLWTWVQQLSASTGLNAEFLAIFGSHMAVFWAMGAALVALDLLASPEYKQQNKIQPGKQLTGADYRHITWHVLQQQLLVIAPLVYGFAVWAAPARAALGIPALAGTGWGTILASLAVYVIIEELGFFSVHAILHHPPLYRAIHKVHHRYSAPVGIAALYQHPVEVALSGVLPMMAGPLLLGSHPLVYCLWNIIAAVNTLVAHSGYALPGLPAPLFHDFHHSAFDGNYGLELGLDKHFGTDAKFYAQRAATLKRLQATAAEH